MSRPPVWVVVLNHKDVHDTLGCLRSIGHLKYRNLTTLVVDNDGLHGMTTASGSSGIRVPAKRSRMCPAVIFAGSMMSDISS